MIEAFDSDLPEALEQSRRETIESSLIKKNESDKTLQLAKPSSTLEINVASPREQHDDDTNLFDEESRLNLVDREDIGEKNGLQAPDGQRNLVVHRSSSQTMQAVQVASDAEAIPAGILSNLAASPEKRRKIKCKPTLPKKDPTQPIILILDSLGQTRSGTVRALKDWLAAEGEAKRGMKATIKEKGYYPKASQIPMQNNWTDCGVYLLGYVDKFFHDPEAFKHKLLTGEMSATEDWPELKPADMRDNMRKIIVKFAEEQKVAKRVERKAKRVVMKANTLRSPLQDEPDEPVKPESKRPQSNQVLSKTLEALETKSEGVRSNNAEWPDQFALSPIEASRPRLASPFNPGQQPEQTVSYLHDADSPLTGTLSVESETKIPRIKQTTRRKSPEVRISVTTPQSAVTRRDGQNFAVKIVHQDEPKGQLHSILHLVSPSKRMRVDENEGQHGVQASKRLCMEPDQHQAKELSARSSPLVQRSREGGAGQPITINDSQEGHSVASHALDQATGWPAQRRAPNGSLHRPRVLRHSPSFEEIPPPTSRITKETLHRPKERFASHELEARLNEADHEQSTAQRSRANSLSTSEAYATSSTDGKDVSEVQDVDVNVLDKGETGVPSYDDVVRETPEANRRSPHPRLSTWTMGVPLPH